MSFKESHLNLTQAQKRQIANAVQNGSGVKLRFKHGQLKHGDKLLLTQRQLNKIEKSYQKGSGCEITLTKNQLNKMKTGGFLPMILPALVGAVAPFLLNKLFPDRSQQQGQGLMEGQGAWDPAIMALTRNSLRQAGKPIPKEFNGDFLPDRVGQGILLPQGHGINLPGGHGINLPRGKGLIKADNGAHMSQHVYGSHSNYLPNVSDPYGSGIMLPGQKKRQVKMLPQMQYGQGFMAPNSDFQLLQ